jgi:predicted GIY-YIG superfamily endonuclease
LAKAGRRSFSEGGLFSQGYPVQYVYLLRSKSHPERTYIGMTENLRNRLKAHNGGHSPHTAKFRPWEIVVAIAFQDEHRARDFERYLKTGSGRAFAKRHFW